MVKPIKPEEVVQETIPDWVIAATNECIKANYLEYNKQAKFTQDTLMDYVLKHAPEGITRNIIFKNHWLDVEGTYRAVGWKVRYYKPPYYEVNEEPWFTFSKE